MKKFLFTALLISVIAGCADNKSTNGGSSTTPPTDEVITISNEAEIGKTSNLSFTLKNPHNVKASVYINFSLTDSSKLQIKDTTCGTLSSNNIDGTLEAGQECTINYTFAPTNLSTDMILLNVDYNKDRTALCNNLTLDNIKTSNIYNIVKVINYAKDTNGNKSTDVIDVVFNSDYIAHSLNKTYTTSNTLTLEKGIYNFIDYNNLSIKALDSNCQVSGSTLEVLGSNPCNLEFTSTTNNPITSVGYTIKLVSTDKVYLLDISYSSDTEYYGTYKNPSGEIEMLVQYTKGIMENYIEAVEITSATDYTITGTNADKFIVEPTPYDGCTVTGTNISLPVGKSSCYITVDFTDTAKQTDGNYTAQISSTTTGITLNIQGTAVANTLDYFRNNMCTTKP